MHALQKATILNHFLLLKHPNYPPALTRTEILHTRILWQAVSTVGVQKGPARPHGAS
jgi:hypothetical protein